MSGGKSVNIIGKGRTWTEAPVDGECWGITQLILRRPVSLVIDMNRYDDGRWGEQEKREAKRALELCAASGIPFVGLDNYPIKEVMAAYDTDYFSSTVDYAIALALYRGYDEIHLYGVTLTIVDYSRLKCGCDFWCGYAKGLGAKVIVHGESTVMKTIDGKVYGYDTLQKTSGAA